MNKTEERTIGEIVAADYRTAAVFQSFGIDFCCKGNKSIEEVCKAKGISQEQVMNALEKVSVTVNNSGVDFYEWPLELLADYIEKKHHRYVEEKTPVLKQYLDKVAKVHGNHHPELVKIRELFYTSAGALTAHMKKEELVLFPFIRKIADADKQNLVVSRPHFGTVQNPVEMMEREHEVEGENFRMIAELTNNYNPPADACNTYRVTFALLKEFESDLHLHIHLENNILFPKAIELENKVCG